MIKGRFFLVAVIALNIVACTPNNVSIDKGIVQKMDSMGMYGTFALMENGTEHFTISDLASYKDSTYAPLGTFFMLPTLIAIDKGDINHLTTDISYDSLGYYMSMMEKIGNETIKKSMDSLHYGKGQVNQLMDGAWRNNTVVITPDEQLGLIKRLYFNQLPFQKRTQEMYKKMILREDNANFKLSYIAAADSTKSNASWVVGYIEENKHPYFFVLHSKANFSDSLLRKNIFLVKNILLEKGFLKGLR